MKDKLNFKKMKKLISKSFVMCQKFANINMMSKKLLETQT